MQLDRPLDLATSPHNLAPLDIVLGRPSRAEPLHRRAYDLRLKALGPRDPAAEAAYGDASLSLADRVQEFCALLPPYDGCGEASAFDA